MDAIYEHDPKKAAAVVRTIRKEHGIEGAPLEFMRAVDQAPTDVRKKYLELVSKAAPSKTVRGVVPSDDDHDMRFSASGYSVERWLDDSKIRFPLGARVRVTNKTDVPEYVGARGRVVGYDVGTTNGGEWPTIRVRFDKPIKHQDSPHGTKVDAFYADGDQNDEIVADR